MNGTATTEWTRREVIKMRIKDVVKLLQRLNKDNLIEVGVVETGKTVGQVFDIQYDGRKLIIVLCNV